MRHSMSSSLQNQNESSQDAEQLSRLITELRYRNDDLQRRNDDLLAVVNRLNDSIGWRILQRFRRIVSVLLPAGTRRRRWSGLVLIRLKTWFPSNARGKQEASLGETAAVKTSEKDRSPVSARPSSSVRTNSSASKKLLLLGLGPLPWEKALRNYAPGRRTWQFLKPLRDDGHDVHLVAARMPRAYEQEPADGALHCSEGFKYYSVAPEIFRDGSYVRRLAESLRPDCIVSVNAWPSPTAVGLRECPVWVDLNGHVMAEGQSKAFRLNEDGPLSAFFNLEYPIICNADIFSAVAESQKWALIGELGLVGRLNRFTDNYEFCHVIPNGIEGPIARPATELIRGKKVGEGDFLILWSGGFNTWCDYELLVSALEEVMTKFAHVKFIATGGQISGHDDVSYPRFHRLVSESRHRDKFILEGWIPSELLPHYYWESDIGINVDRDCYEVRLGSKNRILDWISAGLPPVCSRVCELSLLLESAGLGFTYAPGSREALVECLTKLIRMSRRELDSLRETVRSKALEHLGFDNIMLPLRTWVRDPRFAPDQGRYVRLVKPAGSPQETFRTNALGST